MKNLLTLLLAMTPLVFVGQNQVPNPSFELLSGVNPGPEYYYGEFAYLEASPFNSLGFEPSRTGVDHIAMIGYDNGVPTIRHYLIGKLDPPGLPRDTVNANVSMSLCDEAAYYSGDWGFSFHKGMPDTSFLNVVPEAILPLVTKDSGWWDLTSQAILSDTTNYFLLYSYNNGNGTQVLINPGGTWQRGSYYYIDDICIKKTSTGCDTVLVSRYIPLNTPKKVLGEYDITGRPYHGRGIKITRYSDGTFRKLLKIQ